MPRRGERDPKRERFWRRTIQMWARSGESIRGFCAERELTETAFHAWRRELRRRDGEVGAAKGAAGGSARSKATTRKEPRPRAARFVRVRLVTQPASIELERAGTTIRLHGDVDGEVLTRVLQAVSRVSC